MLKDIFTRQRELQKRLKNDITSQEFINEQILATVDELMEALRETPWKSWKKNQTLNEENFKEELIDVWHFLINLSLASGMDSIEVYKRFVGKNQINHKRQDEKY